MWQQGILGTRIQQPCLHTSARWPKTSLARATQATVPHLWSQECLQRAGLRLHPHCTMHKETMATISISRTSARHLWLHPAPVGPHPHPPATSSSIRDCNRLWWIEDESRGTQDRSWNSVLLFGYLHYPTMLTLHTCPKGLSRTA